VDACIAPTMEASITTDGSGVKKAVVAFVLHAFVERLFFTGPEGGFDSEFIRNGHDHWAWFFSGVPIVARLPMNRNREDRQPLAKETHFTTDKCL